jgi:hypothetical protein
MLMLYVYNSPTASKIRDKFLCCSLTQTTVSAAQSYRQLGRLNTLNLSLLLSLVIKKKLNSSLWVADDTRLTTVDMFVVVDFNAMSLHC